MRWVDSFSTPCFDTAIECKSRSETGLGEFPGFMPQQHIQPSRALEPLRASGQKHLFSLLTWIPQMNPELVADDSDLLGFPEGGGPFVAGSLQSGLGSGALGSELSIFPRHLGAVLPGI